MHKITIIPSYSNLTTWLNHAVLLTFQIEPMVNTRTIKTTDIRGIQIALFSNVSRIHLNNCKRHQMYNKQAFTSNLKQKL
jgi:hypothetical protein